VTFVLNLPPCTHYEIALKTRDGTGPSFKNWSLLSNVATVETFCSGGGGGFSAERVDGDREGTSSPAFAAPSTDGNDPGTALAGVIVAETQRTHEGGWRVTLRRLAQAEGVDVADTDAIGSQVPDGSGGWKTLGRYRPSPGQSPLGLCALRHEGRMVIPSGYTLDRVGSGIRAGAQDLSLSAANHSRLGSLGDAFVDNGGAVELGLGESLTLDYSSSGAGLEGAPSWYLLMRPSVNSESAAAPARRVLATTVPTRFALHQNKPNPFHRTTTITFDLPVASLVKLDVFDLLGRRVATLAEGEYPAGVHAVDYDLRESGGGPLPAGVYVYRLQAGTFVERRKLTVLP
jgi:hypothetical protein